LGNVTLPVTFGKLYYGPRNARPKIPTGKPCRQSGPGTCFTYARAKFMKSEYATPHGYTEQIAVVPPSAIAAGKTVGITN
jgi:hypothetical protein